jgi:hypothetical protein
MPGSAPGPRAAALANTSIASGRVSQSDPPQKRSRWAVFSNAGDVVGNSRQSMRIGDFIAGWAAMVVMRTPAQTLAHDRRHRRGAPIKGDAGRGRRLPAFCLAAAQPSGFGLVSA